MPDAGGASALYLHVPFCVSKCAYCDFASWATAARDPLMAAYASALSAQLGELSATGLLDGCETAYVGGGTPTFLGGSALGGLVGAIYSVAPSVGELSCEANPDSLTDEVLDALVRAGTTRLSIGVQSLSDLELSSLGRAHDALRAKDSVVSAIAAGLDVSCDLMCATPEQTAQSWEATLAAVVGLGVGHVSVYPLQIEEGTPLAERLGDDEPAWNDPGVQASRMEAAACVLEKAGLARYEVASYARPGKACRHNQAYWTGRPYLGLGTGAASMLDRAGYLHLREVCPQLPDLAGDVARVRARVTTGRSRIARDPALRALSFELELLDEGQAAAEDLMLGMRLACGVSDDLLGRARGLFGGQRVDGALERCLGRGLARRHDGWLVPTHDGWLLGNELYGELWGLAETAPRVVSC